MGQFEYGLISVQLQYIILHLNYSFYYDLLKSWYNI